MPPVSLRTNFTDLKALDFFSCAVVFRYSRSCSVALTRMSDDPEQKMSRQSWESQRQQNGSSKCMRPSKRERRNCAMNYGRELRRTYRRQNRTAETHPHRPTPFNGGRPVRVFTTRPLHL